MTLTLSSLANDGTERIGAAPADHGLAGALNDLAYAAIRPLRYRMLYNKIIGDLMPLDDEVLNDIGLARWDIATYARNRAELRWPARHSMRVVLVGVAASVSRALKRGRNHRMTIDNLMALDDRTLKDIGLSRCQIPWIADEVARRSGELDGVTPEHPPAVHDMARVDDRTSPGKQSPQGLVPFDASSAPAVATPANDGRVLRAS